MSNEMETIIRVRPDNATTKVVDLYLEVDDDGDVVLNADTSDGNTFNVLYFTDDGIHLFAGFDQGDLGGIPIASDGTVKVHK